MLIQKRINIKYFDKIVITIFLVVLTLRNTQFDIVSNKVLPLFLVSYLFIEFLLFLKGKDLYCVLFLFKRWVTEYYLFFLFPIWCVITSIWSFVQSETIYKSLYLFLIVIFLLRLKREKQIFTLTLLQINIVVNVLLFFSLIFNFPLQNWSGGNAHGYMGFFVHQNTLAAYLLFSTCYYFAEKIEFNYMSITIIVFNLIFIFLSYSRASILVMVLILFVRYYLFLIKYKRATLIVLLLFSSTVIFQQNYFMKVLEKGNNQLLGNRIELWKGSFIAAKNNLYFGVGFGLSDKSVRINASGNRMKNEIFYREKGNGFLALIEETGIIGFVFFIIPLIEIKKYINHTKLLLLLALLLHTQFEAWTVGVTSFSLFIYLVIITFNYNNKSISYASYNI